MSGRIGCPFLLLSSQGSSICFISTPLLTVPSPPPPHHPPIAGNAVKSLKQVIASTGVRGIPEAEAKEEVLAHIERYIQERLVMADNLIVELAVQKIQDGDVILTHAHSYVVSKILERAFDVGRKFRVVVVDSRPALEGRTTLRRLLRKGISCTYTHLGAVSYAMREVCTPLRWALCGCFCVTCCSYEFASPHLCDGC